MVHLKNLYRFLEVLARWRWEFWERNSLGQQLYNLWSQAFWRQQLGNFGNDSLIYPHVAIHSPRLVRIGNRVNVAEFVHIWGRGGVEIGDNTIIASHVVIASQTHDKHAEIFRDSNLFKPVKIGTNCWIGAHAVILPGVEIGHSSIVGAGSVVTRDVLPRTVVAGIPARILESLPPPHRFKVKVVKSYAGKFRLTTLIETGTYLGAMIDAVKDDFKKIYSIELDQKLAAEATNKYINEGKIKILAGDSAKVLRDLLAKFNGRAIFWLDAHFSGGITAKCSKETPIMEELKLILSNKKSHVILIDDARFFGKRKDYPSILMIKRLISKYGDNYETNIADDIIRLTPKLNR